MFERVLVALDFSACSQKILDHIGDIPGIEDVVLLHVVDATHPSKRGWTYGPHIENTKILMTEKKESLERRGLKVQMNVDVLMNVITQGNVSHAILEAAEAYKVSLIIIGARGINPIRELLLGSVSSSVIRHATTNVLVMHLSPDAEDASALACLPNQPVFSKVLVPIDFSRSARDASEFIKTIPGIKEIILMHVVSKVESQDAIEASVKEAQIRLSEMGKDFTESSHEAKLHVRVGDPTEMILSVADEDDVSMIALSAFGTEWFREMLLGSTTFTVVRRTRKPVLVIRSRPEKDIR